MKHFLTILLLAAATVNGAQWYVSPSGAGAKDGQSWDTAWALGDIVWGGGGVNPGDTINLDGGATSQRYTATTDGMFTIGLRGTPSSRITIRVGQDEGHNGNVIFDGAHAYSELIYGQDVGGYVTIDGEYNGACHWYFTNVVHGTDPEAYVVNFHGNMVAPTNTIIRYLDIEAYAGGIDAKFIHGGQVEHCKIVGVRGKCAIYMVGSQMHNESGVYVGEPGWDKTILNNNVVQCYHLAGQGNGPDGLETSWGCTIYSNSIHGEVGSIIPAEHQDLIQQQGQYWKIYNNEIWNSGDSCVDHDTMGGSAVCYGYIYNNVFRNDDGNGTCGVRLYNSYGWAFSSVHDIWIEGNTFADFSKQLAADGVTRYGAALSLRSPNSASSANDTHIRNNIFYNCGGGYSCVMLENINLAQLDFDYNVVNAGAHGNTSISGATQAHGQTGAPTFAVYTEYNPNNDYHLKASDTVATDNGVVVDTYTKDKDNVTRGASYDIGAYEGAGGSPDTNPFVTLSLTSTNFGYVRVGDTRTVSIGVTNIGTNALVGTATGAASPWSVTAGGTYNLTSGNGQTLTVQYAPSATNSADSCIITFPGASNAASFSLNAKAYPLLSGLAFTPEQCLSEQPIVVSNGVAYWTAQITTPASAGRLTVGILATNAGTYYLSNNIYAAGDGANSIYVSADNEPTEPGNVWDIYPYQSYWTNLPAANRGSSGDPNADEFNPKSWTFSAGTYHRFIICTREPDTLMGTWTIGAPSGEAPPAVTNLVIINNLNAEKFEAK